jgi:hypothetical protein
MCANGSPECLERTKAALAALEAAQQGNLRAKAWCHDCEVALHRHDSLEAELSAATIAGLRGASGKPDLAPFASRIAEREAAQAALTAAQAAAIELMTEIAGRPRNGTKLLGSNGWRWAACSKSAVRHCGSRWHRCGPSSRR